MSRGHYHQLFSQTQVPAVYIAVGDMTNSYHTGTWKSVEQEATFTFDPGILVGLLHSIILAELRKRY
jgi:hypothetical protein